MTTIKLLAPPASASAPQFPEMPPRDDMQNIINLHRPGHITALTRHLGNPETTLVLGEIPVGWIPGEATGLLVPDLIVAFDVDPDAIMAARGYAVFEREKPPDFVLEVASIHTARNDFTYKRQGYAAYGVSEYWRFDDTGGRYYPTGLAGDRLVNETYHPIPIHRVDNDRYWGHSDVLNLDLCWEYGELRWYDPINQRYLPTHDDEADGRMAAEADLLMAQIDRDAERRARLAAEAQRAAAETQRDAAETQRDAAEAQRADAEAQRADAEARHAAAVARKRELEAELARLRNPQPPID